MPEKVHHQLYGDSTASKPGLEEPPKSSRKRKRKEHLPATDHLKLNQRDHEYAVSSNGFTNQKANGSIAIPNPQHENLDKTSSASRLPTTMNKKPQVPKSVHQASNSNSIIPAQHSKSLKTKAQALWQKRKELPIWAQADTIRQSLRRKDVLLLVGETGSGKSTQVPQILVKEPWCRARTVMTTFPDDAAAKNKSVKVGGCIAITEPRRVAAISLARRVAEEVGTPLGSASPASTVGYSVRFDNSTGPNTRIKFLTEGMLLQEMLRDPWLTAYSAVIVDEVHERGVSVDLVMGFLREMVGGSKEGRGGVPLKVGIMSATVSMEGMLHFFEAGYGKPAVNGNLEAHSDVYERQEDDSEWSGIADSDVEDNEQKSTQNKDDSRMNDLNRNFQESNTNINQPAREVRRVTNGLHKSNRSLERPEASGTAHIAACYIEGRQYPVRIMYSQEPVQDFVDAALRTIFQIHYKEPMPGDILVFLTGQATVESLEKLVKEYALGMSPEVPKILVLPLFAALPQSAQQRVFQAAPPAVRKVIIATNIAETSVTVSGVRFVIDCGKSKIKQFRSRIGLDSLLVKPISKSAATQRKGRAGREAPGHCYRLYTEQDYLLLEAANTPEILRCDLSQAVLTMKARGISDIFDFPFLDRPPREALEKALIQLVQLKALNDLGEISQIGLEMAKLPLTASLGRVLLAAADPEFSCIEEVIDIISCLSVENVFLSLNTEEKEEQAQTTRGDLYRREGDHLTLLATVRAYNAEHTDRKAWAERYFVSHRAMQAVMVSLQDLFMKRHLT